jgi:hypothetical protein
MQRKGHGPAARAGDRDFKRRSITLLFAGWIPQDRFSFRPSDAFPRASAPLRVFSGPAEWNPLGLSDDTLPPALAAGFCEAATGL